MEDVLSFLDGETPAEPAIAPEAGPDQTAAPGSETQPRGPDGKFAPKSPEPLSAEPAASAAGAEEPPPAAASEAPPAVPSAPPPGFVPVAVVADLREKLRLATQPPAAPPPPAPEPPDRYDDPDGYEAYQRSQTQTLILSNKLDMSEDMARSRHTEEVVDAAKDWAKTRFAASPAYAQELFSHRNPYEKLVQDYRRDQVVSGLKDEDLSEFNAWRAARAQAQAAPAAATPPAPPTPPRSILHAPGSGGAKPGEIPHGPGQAFDNAIPR